MLQPLRLLHFHAEKQHTAPPGTAWSACANMVAKTRATSRPPLMTWRRSGLVPWHIPSIRQRSTSVTSGAKRTERSRAYKAYEYTPS